MIYELSKGERMCLWPLIEGWQETLLWSCLQGHMGRAWADGPEAPQSARILVGDFFFFAGRPNRALAAMEEGFGGFAILTPQTKAWEDLLEAVWGNRAERAVRWAIRKEPDVFDRARLHALAAALPEGFLLRAMDQALCEQAAAMDWSRDLCSQFDGIQDYVNRGIGMAAVYNGRLVSGASSYTVYDGGIEIEIDTDPAFRNRGLATACGAALILQCLDRGLYPSWDAHDLRSVHLAEKLGYHRAGPYPVFLLQISSVYKELHADHETGC